MFETKNEKGIFAISIIVCSNLHCNALFSKWGIYNNKFISDFGDLWDLWVHIFKIWH